MLTWFMNVPVCFFALSGSPHLSQKASLDHSILPMHERVTAREKGTNTANSMGFVTQVGHLTLCHIMYLPEKCLS